MSIATLEDDVHGTGGGSITLQLEGPDKPEGETIETAYIIYAQETADGRHLSRATVTVLDDDEADDSTPTVTVSAANSSVERRQTASFHPDPHADRRRAQGAGVAEAAGGPRGATTAQPTSAFAVPDS